MIDWRRMEDAIVDALRRRGARPSRSLDATGNAEVPAGEWYLAHDGEKINLSSIARDLVQQVR